MNEEEYIVAVPHELIQNAQIFLKEHKTDITIEDLLEASHLRALIINEISKQNNEIKTKISEMVHINESGSTVCSEDKAAIKFEKELKKIKDDETAKYLVNSLHSFISDNSTCDLCKDAISLIGVYKNLEVFNHATIQEINQLRNDLCNAKENCKKPGCIAKLLIDQLDSDEIKNKKFK